MAGILCGPPPPSAGGHMGAKPHPREFLVRHRTGARFAALPEAVQDEALEQLSAWAEKTFGSFDSASREEHSFELEVFEF